MSAAHTQLATARDWRELTSRENDGLEVSLLWSRSTNRVKVSVADLDSDQEFEFDVPSANALDAFEHPFAFVPTRRLVVGRFLRRLRRRVEHDAGGDVFAGAAAGDYMSGFQRERATESMALPGGLRNDAKADRDLDEAASGLVGETEAVGRNRVDPEGREDVKSRPAALLVSMEEAARASRSSALCAARAERQ
jgi:hypothetical protein